jgi:hypothetical protein
MHADLKPVVAQAAAGFLLEEARCPGSMLSKIIRRIINPGGTVMSIFQMILKRLSLSMSIVALMTGCVGANLSSKIVTAGEFQLSSAKVRWDESAGYRLQHYRSANHVRSEADARAAQAYVAPLMKVFREKSSSRIEALLAARGVPAGEAFTIVIKPQTIIEATVGARNLVLDVIVLDRSGVRAKLDINAVGTMSVEPDAILDAFAEKLVNEFAKSGWISGK